MREAVSGKRELCDTPSGRLCLPPPSSEGGEGEGGSWSEVGRALYPCGGGADGAKRV